MEAPLIFFIIHKIIEYIFVNGNAHADVAPPPTVIGLMCIGVSRVKELRGEEWYLQRECCP